MAEKVLLTISTLQGEDGELIETKSEAEYYQRSGVHYLLFEENLEGFSTAFQSRLKIKQQHVELKRQGATDVNMIFEEGKKHMTRYVTPYGELLLDISTQKVKVEEKEEGLYITIEYVMETDGALLSTYQLKITTTQKGI